MRTGVKVILVWVIWMVVNLIPFPMYVISEGVPVSDLNIALVWLMISAAINGGIWYAFVVIDIVLPIALTVILFRPRKK